MKKTWELPLVLAAILIVFLINFVIYLAARLEEPVFLSHYYSVPMEDWMSLDFSYIANRDENKEILSVSLPELDYLEGMPRNCNKEDYGVYSLYDTSIEFHFPKEMRNSDLIFTEMEILCADGTKSRVDVGEVHLYVPMEESEALSLVACGKEADGSAYVAWYAQEDVEILGITHYGQNRFSDVLYLRDGDGQEVTFPMKLAAGEEMEIIASMELLPGDYRRQEVVGIHPWFQTRTSDGSLAEFSAGEMVVHEPNLGFRQIYRILKMKGAI
ncbi:hypothetical protein H9X85_07230 [Anaerotignum lactatifermentans]|uniref:Uncharacterized protein n=1 Tax=Anaerotignum lactatifermentans TaxID=160404 RepID=A0ABS2G8I2_9FIRM|nr:hypothetical protein [Anaerotignum lactatifermentans]MBM6829423.1 hypothetical protein [Anaerotignum lactatifermentans]MBM6877781.1 hypothetical protein [Anaerotignum lactatifermentans]MBM6951000.1 hypothetical protein [Anaerotignum lactatifermentans]